MKRYSACIAMALLAGCADQPKAPDTPAGLSRLYETPAHSVYFDRQSVSLYEGNENLRQFDNIVNPTTPLTARRFQSIRYTAVINCVRSEQALMGAVYFTEPFAKGIAVVGPAAPQWQPFPKNSHTGEVADIVCNLDAKVLRASGPEFRGHGADH